MIEAHDADYPAYDDELPLAAPKRPFPLQLVVSVLTLLLVAGLLGVEIWKINQHDAAGLADKVRDSMTAYLREDPDFSSHSPMVTNITVMHASENTFEGQATVTASGTSQRDVPVHIVYDGDLMFWRTDPGAFLFITLNNS